MHILVIEDDLEGAKFLLRGLQNYGHHVEHATTGEEGYQIALSRAFDVMVVDWLLAPEGIDGLEVIRKLRESGITTPALVLSARKSVDHRITGLSSGGDDYVTKPYALDELHARLHAIYRRAHPEQDVMLLQVGDLKLDLLRRQVSRDEVPITLQPREFRLLEYLMRNAGQVVTRAMLLQNVWDYNFDPQTNVIDVQISRLRAKIDRGFDLPLLQTVRGAGYRLVDPNKELVSASP